jgi:hypothetical protein
MSDQQKRLVKKRTLLEKSDSMAGAQPQIQLGPVVWALMFLLVNDRGIWDIPLPAAQEMMMMMMMMMMMCQCQILLGMEL